MALKYLRPKEPRWAIATGAVAAASAVAYVVVTLGKPLNPARGAGLVFGILASVLFLVEAAYPLRRRFLAKPLGTARIWIQLHVWGGALAALFVLMHAGFRTPSGTMGWALFLLTLWVTATGLLGVALQKYYPFALSRNLSVEALFERIPELAAKLVAEADKLLADASDVLDGFYRAEIRPALDGVAPSWAYLADVRGNRDKRLAPFTRIVQFVPEGERGRLEDLKTIFVEKLELDAHYSVQRALRGWTILHVPPSALLLWLSVIHVVSFFLY